MEKKILKTEFEEGLKYLELEYDIVIMTWGVSHYRYAKGLKEEFKSTEEFFKEVMLSPFGFEGSIGTSNPWSKRTNFESYINGLIITESTEQKINNVIKHSVKEAKEYEKDWQDQYKQNIDSIEFPKNHSNVLEIREATDERFLINTYIGFISQNYTEYFFIESHIEQWFGKEIMIHLSKK